MNATRIGAVIAGIVAVFAIAVALVQMRNADAAAAAVARLRQQQAALAARVPELRERIAHAEKRAADAERDSGELLQVVEALRAKNAVAAAAARTPVSRGDVVGAVGPVVSPMGTLSEEERDRLAQERAYQQELARTRAAQAKARAQLEEALVLSPAANRFMTRIDAARQSVASGDLQSAIRLFNQAMQEKPPDIPITDDIAELRQTLAGQNIPVEVTITSDGVTYVSIANVRGPGRFTTARVRMVPGDYEVIGRRRGYRDIRLLLQVRAGVPLAPVSVVCSESVPPGP